MKITEDEARSLAIVRQKQQQNAKALGAARAEYLRREDDLMQTIERTSKELKITGETILMDHGIDYSKAEYRINSVTNEIEELRAGAWVPVEEDDGV